MMDSWIGGLMVDGNDGILEYWNVEPLWGRHVFRAANCDSPTW